MQILASFDVIILALKIHPEKINKKNPGCAYHRSPPAALAQLACDSRMRSWEVAFQTRCPSLDFSNVGKYALVYQVVY